MFFPEKIPFYMNVKCAMKKTINDKKKTLIRNDDTFQLAINSNYRILLSSNQGNVFLRRSELTDQRQTTDNN